MRTHSHRYENILNIFANSGVVLFYSIIFAYFFQTAYATLAIFGIN